MRLTAVSSNWWISSFAKWKINGIKEEKYTVCLLSGVVKARLCEPISHHHHGIVQLNHQADCHHVYNWWHYCRFPGETTHGLFLDGCRRSLCFELIVSRLFVIAHAAFSLPVTAWRRVQSGSEWCPDGLETLIVRQTSPAAPQLCTPGELWSHCGGIRVVPETLQHHRPDWSPLHVQTAEAGGLWSRGACEPGELVEIRLMMLIMDDHTGYTVGDKANRFIPSLLL